MTCREAQKRLVDLFDAAPPRTLENELRSHLAACEDCTREYADALAAVASIEPPERAQPSPDFKERVMKEIMEIPPAVRPRHNFFSKLAVAVAAAVVLVVLAPILVSLRSKGNHVPAPVFSLLAQSVQAMSGIESVHMTARMRTLPRDNFEYINPECDWVPLDIYKQFGDPAKWRVEKAGRVVVMDGASTLLWIKPNMAARGRSGAGFIEWLYPLLDTGKIFDNELAAARAGAATAQMSEETRDGAREIVLSVKRSSKVPVTDWLHNKNVSTSDQTRVYRFDAASKRFSGMQLLVHRDSSDVAVFEITSVRYNEALAPSLFTLDLPANVIWSVSAEQMPVTSEPLPTTPKDVATLLFDALARQDWRQALVVIPASDVAPVMKEIYGGLQVISIGEPFQSVLYRGWFVPYEIKLKNGYVKKHNLAVRNDNPGRRWMFDGGL
jgi:outer membrane lipoprotein-sorting protein